MNRFIKYALTAVIGILGFSCKTSQKAIDQDNQKKRIERPDDNIKLMYGAPPVTFEVKDSDIKRE